MLRKRCCSDGVIMQTGGRQRRHKTLIMLVTIALVLLVGGAVQAAPGATITVDGSCTLADAITAANSDTATGNCPAGSGADTILLNKNVSLSSALPKITTDMTIQGNKAHEVAGNGGDRIFYVDNNLKQVTFRDLVILGGEAKEGAGIFIGNDSTVNIEECEIYKNTATDRGAGIMIHGGSVVSILASNIHDNAAKNDGGGIYVYYAKSVTIDKDAQISKNTASNGSGGGINAQYTSLAIDNDTVIEENTAKINGGGIALVKSDMSMNQARVAGNSAGNDGGGIYATDTKGKKVTITESTITKNKTTRKGGGMYAEGVSVSIDKCTIDNNDANDGGGVYLYEVSGMTIATSTFSGNTATDTGGGVRLSSSDGQMSDSTIFNNMISQGNGQAIYLGDSSKLSVANSIVAHGKTALLSIQAPQTPLAVNDCDWDSSSGLGSDGYNLESGTSCKFTLASDQQKADPLLGPLQNNGGPTYTHFPRTKSPIIDQGKAVASLDQRGESRPVDLSFYANGGGDASDIGAVEVQKAGPNAVTLQNMRSQPGTPFLLALFVVATFVLLGLVIGISEKKYL